MNMLGSTLANSALLTTGSNSQDISFWLLLQVLPLPVCPFPFILELLHLALPFFCISICIQSSYDVQCIVWDGNVCNITWQLKCLFSCLFFFGGGGVCFLFFFSDFISSCLLFRKCSKQITDSGNKCCLAVHYSNSQAELHREPNPC